MTQMRLTEIKNDNSETLQLYNTVLKWFGAISCGSSCSFNKLAACTDLLSTRGGHKKRVSSDACRIMTETVAFSPRLLRTIPVSSYNEVKSYQIGNTE